MLLNLDAGESPDETEELWSCADVLSIACGGHAGDATSMARVVEFCARSSGRALRISSLPPSGSGMEAQRAGARLGTPAIGAHPSYPDRDGFGRRTIAIDRAALAASIEAQCAALAAIARDHGVMVEYVKLHGALYHDASRDIALAELALGAASRGLGDDFVSRMVRRYFGVIGPADGALAAAAAALGLRYMREGFADRRMRADGSLVPRGEPDALITRPAAAAAQARALLRDVDTVCVHGDTPNAIAIARAVREAIAIRPRAQRVDRIGDRAIRFARPRSSPRAVVDVIRAWPGVVDVVVAVEDVAVYFDAASDLRQHVDVAQIDALDALPAEAPVREVEIRCVYDGEDLDAVARACELDVAGVVRMHESATYTVDAIGFAPGFAYLAGLPPELHLPRRATPRPRVPAGSLAIADRFTAVYPFDSPAGWHVIGRIVDEPMFTSDGARLAYGDRVRFVSTAARSAP